MSNRPVEPEMPLDVLGIVAAATDRVFENLTALAGSLCGVPLAAVGVVDRGREYFAATTGSLVTGHHDGSSFCSHVVAGREAFEVVDAAADDRFRLAPFVTSAPWVQFCAGAPVILGDGSIVGALCVMDVVPRRLTPDQRRDLVRLAAQLASQLELRWRNAALAAAQIAQLRDRQALDGVVQQTDVMIYAKDLAGRFILANPVLEATLAVPGGLLGRRDDELFTVEMADVFRSNDIAVATERVRQEFEENLAHPDGSVHVYRSTKFPLLDDQQQVYGIAGVSTDVTELITTRAALAESEQRWRALVEHSPVAVAVIGGDGRFCYANPEAVTLYGGTVVSEVEGQPARDFVDAQDREEIGGLFQAVLAGGPPVRGRRWRLRQLGGRHRTVEINAVGVLHRGAPAVQVEVRDVSIQAAAQKELQDSERRFHTVFNDSPVAMALSDEQGRWVETNAAFGVLLGVPPTDLIGKTALQYAHPEDHHLIDGSEQGQQDSPDRVHRLEVRFIRPDSTIRWAWVSITATPGPEGRSWTLAIVQDITTRKAAEEALRQSDSDLAAIATVTRSVQAGLDPRPAVVQAIKALSGASTVAMLELSDPQTLEVTASAGREAVGIAVSLLDLSMTATVWRTGEAVFLSDAADNPIVNPALLALDGTISALWQPVVVQGQVQAMLNVTWQHRVADFSDRAVRSVAMVANEAGVAMHAVQMQQELQRSALTDPLTGSLNRRAWDEQMAQMVDQVRAGGQVLTVALVDLDHFKVYNDTYGHGAGDILLRDFADAARESLRHTDVFARWGGEEFIVAIPGATEAQATTILDRIRRCVPDHRTCSIGYTRWITDEPIATTIARADVALYDAKRGGRNRLASR